MKTDKLLEAYMDILNEDTTSSEFNQLLAIQTYFGQVFNGHQPQLSKQDAKNYYFVISNLLKQSNPSTYSTTPTASFDSKGNYQTPSQVAKSQGHPNPYS